MTDAAFTNFNKSFSSKLY